MMYSVICGSSPENCGSHPPPRPSPQGGRLTDEPAPTKGTPLRRYAPPSPSRGEGRLGASLFAVLALSPWRERVDRAERETGEGAFLLVKLPRERLGVAGVDVEDVAGGLCRRFGCEEVDGF